MREADDFCCDWRIKGKRYFVTAPQTEKPLRKERCQNLVKSATIFYGRTVSTLPAGVGMDRNGVNRWVALT